MKPTDTAWSAAAATSSPISAFPTPTPTSSRPSWSAASTTSCAIAAMTQTEAGRLMGLSQPDVSRLLRGDFREYSLERLFRLLNALGRDIDIVIRQPRSADGARLRIAAGEPV